MMHADDDIHMVITGSLPQHTVINHFQGVAGGWLALEFTLDGRDMAVMYEIVESLEWRNVTFGCTIEATIRCRDFSDLATLWLADRGTRGLKWHPADCAASCRPCLNPSGLVAFVEYFTPDAAVELVGDARIEFAGADVLGQFVLACDVRHHQFQGACPV